MADEKRTARIRHREPLSDAQMLMLISIGIFAAMYVLAMLTLKGGFLKPQQIFDLLNDNAALIIISCSLTVVMIGGGLIGCELALHLAMKGRQVSILARRELLRRAKLPPMNEFMLRDLLAFHKVEILNGTSPVAIRADGVQVSRDGEERFLPADTVILAVGEEPVRGLYDEIRNDFENVIAIGDCREVRNIQSAIWDAFETARTL